MITKSGNLSVLLGIDPRSLALFRICLAALLLCDLAIRSADLSELYSGAAVLPSEAVKAFYHQPGRWSLHFLGGSVAYQATLFVVAAVLAAMLLVGMCSRVAAIGSWVLLISLQMRMPLILNGGDILLRMLLFWAMFLPLGHRWSFDAWRRPQPAASSGSVLSVASAALLLQLAFMYFFTGMFKYNDVWLDGEAIYYALSLDAYGKPLGRYLLGFPTLLSWLTVATLWLELIGPVLLFIPWRTGTIRLVVMSLFVAMHVAIELSMTVGMFSYVSICGWIVFLPRGFWNVLLGGDGAVSPDLATPTALRPRVFWIRRSADALCGVLLFYVLVWNIATLPSSRRKFSHVMPRPLARLGRILQIGQQWNMFTRPSANDGWYVAAARLKDGSRVDLLRAPAEPDLEVKPDRISAMFPNHRWRKLYRNLTRRANREFQPRVARWLCDHWNAEHAADVHVVEMDFYYIREQTQPNHAPPLRSTRKLCTVRLGSPQETGIFERAARDAERSDENDPLLP